MGYSYKHNSLISRVYKFLYSILIPPGQIKKSGYVPWDRPFHEISPLPPRCVGISGDRTQIGMCAPLLYLHYATCKNNHFKYGVLNHFHVFSPPEGRKILKSEEQNRRQKGGDFFLGSTEK